MVAQMGVKAVVTAVEMVAGSGGLCYRALEMTAAVAVNRILQVMACADLVSTKCMTTFALSKVPERMTTSEHTNTMSN